MTHWQKTVLLLLSLPCLLSPLLALSFFVSDNLALGLRGCREQSALGRYSQCECVNVCVFTTDSEEMNIYKVILHRQHFFLNVSPLYFAVSKMITFSLNISPLTKCFVSYSIEILDFSNRSNYTLYRQSIMWKGPGWLRIHQSLWHRLPPLS